MKKITRAFTRETSGGTSISDSFLKMSFGYLTTFPLEELIAHARAHSPFYQLLYAELSAAPTLVDLPVIDQHAYWEAHRRDRQEVLTERQRGGFILNSGGTTGAPKHSYYTPPEWTSNVELSARSFDAAGLQDGDRVATLFASGNLYASLMFATESLKRIRAQVVQLPVGYSAAFADAAKVLSTFQVNVLAGFPTHLLRIIDALDAEGASGLQVERIIFAGELFTPDQQGFLKARFPGLHVHSAGYASVEAGPIGYADAGCTSSEHRVADGITIVEILDEKTDEPITATEQAGRIVFTSLVRRLMPMLRYPTGDRAQWVEPPGAADRKFLLLGRSEEAARVGSDMLQVAEANTLLELLRGKVGLGEFQLLVTRVQLHDLLTFRLVGNADSATLHAAAEEFLQTFRARRPDFEEAILKKMIHPPRVEWVRRDQLIVHERTGKLLRVVDRRNG